MSTVIKVENLGKQYTINHAPTGATYITLRDVIANKIFGLTQKSGRFLQKKTVTPLCENFWALKNLNFELKKGERLGIIGKNGAGKSTFLKLLSRITEPSTGQITLRGRVASLLEVGTGFHPELTGRENIFLNGAILGMSKKEISSKFDEIVDFSGVENFLDTPVKRYSSGMYVRLAFSVAAHLEPEILVVDEVLAVGDLEFQQKCLGRMENISRDGKTIIFVSHNMGAIQQLCTKAMLLKDGGIYAEGECEPVIEKYITSVARDLDSSRIYERNTEKKLAQIRKISVTDGEKKITHIDIKDDFIINIEYELYKNLSGINVGMQIIKITGGEPVLSNPDTELDFSRLNERKRGRYQAKLRIPCNLLNTGKYIVKVGITGKYNIYDVTEDIVFEVIDQAGIVNHLGRSRKNSILSTQIPWDVKLIQSF